MLPRMNTPASAPSRTVTPAAGPLPAATLVATLLILGTLLCALPALAIDKKPAKMWDDLSDLKVEAFQMEEGIEYPPYYDCYLSNFYYVPCPTYSWFWAYSGWEPGDIIGSSFTIGEQPTGPGWPCDPQICGDLRGIQVLDFAGYGTVYPGKFTFELEIYYVDTTGAPGCNIWNSGPLETGYGWNYFEADRPVDLWACPGFCFPWDQGCPYPTFLVTMKFTGTDGGYPALGFDNVSKPAESGCAMHDTGCLPAVYPRAGPGASEPKVYSGYVGTYPFEYWPPRPFPDGKHATQPSGEEWYGFVEPAWRIYLYCSGPTASPPEAQPATWGTLKSLYK
jgi:hypothetical protein